MLTDFETFKKALLDSGYKVFRDQAPKNTPYPYLIYSYIGETQKWASNKFIVSKGLYQVSLFTKGIEQDLNPLKKALKIIVFILMVFLLYKEMKMMIRLLIFIQR
ncbi:hypothetical protein [Enterococcus faecalis]|uniref:hypothetical protein n=1 Tax=Enterococcus faecalis TaxID=1351 RepID=UPI0001E967E2|nr:hypothetical protein HMPREF9510_02144 [Enterococcus faecalis TX0470]EOJ99894.1 hypothetical protein WOM_02326 [Enterococcus faecalis EnGen0360]ETC92412.1 hypothetical protein T481_06780 [Enterococcus faecalis PF3]